MLHRLQRTIQQQRSIVLLKLDECGISAAARSVHYDICVNESFASNSMVVLQRDVQAFVIDAH